MLAAWQSGGVPQHILSRLEAGWALCLCADDADALPGMQSALAQLSLPAAMAARLPEGAYAAEDAQLLSSAGVSILLHSDAASFQQADGVWHVPTTGIQSRTMTSQYSSAAAASGGAAAFVISDAQGEEAYSASHLNVLLQITARDRSAGNVHSLPISQALDAHIAHLQRIDKLPEWLRQQAALEESLSDINERIQMIAPQ